MDASCKIQRSIHDVRLTYKYVSRILGTYQLSVRITKAECSVVPLCIIVSITKYDHSLLSV